MSKCKKIHDAIMNDDIKTVKSLTQHGTDVNCVYQQETAFTWAIQCKRFKCASVIMASKRFNPNVGNQFERTPLFMAAKLGRPDFVRRLLEMGARVNDSDIRGVTPLGACAWYDSHECAQILIQRGANVDQPDAVGQTPLYRACSNVSKNVVRVLLEHSCDVNLPTCDRKTPLMAALPSCNNLNDGKTLTDMISVCGMLKSKGCDMNAQDEQGRTALHQTIANKDIHGMCFLAEHGCDLGIKDNSGHTAFHIAILPRTPRYEMAKYLLHFGADCRSQMLNPYEYDNPNILPLCLLLMSRPYRSMDANSKWARTQLLQTMSTAVNPNQFAMHYHANRRERFNRDILYENLKLEIIQMLKERSPSTLQLQAKLKVRDLIGNKNSVTKINSLPICETLKQDLNLGLDNGNASPESVSRLHMAIQDRQNDELIRLLEEGTSTSMHLQHRNALTMAIEVDNTEAAIMITKTRHLASKVIRSKAITPSQETALHIASKHGRTELVREIVCVARNVNAKDATGGTPLHDAIAGGHFNTAKVLILNGANVAIYAHGVPIVHLAAASGAPKVVKLLLKRGWDVNTRDTFGNTPLHVAASKGIEYMYRHIKLPALYNSKTRATMDAVRIMMTTANPSLTNRISTQHLKIVRFLLIKGADVTAVNNQSKTALMLGEDIEDVDIMNALKKYTPKI